MGDFGELRSLLHVDLSEREGAWDRLLTVMQKEHKKNPGRVTDEWLPYALAGLEGWSDAWRLAPRTWVNALIRGEDVGPLLALARGVDASRMTNPRFQKMCATPGFSWVRHLRFGEYDFKLASGQALGDSEAFSGLTSLEFCWTTPGHNKSVAMFRNPFVANLRSLSYLNCQAQSRMLIPFCSGEFASLEILALENLNVYQMEWDRLANLDLPSLRHACFAGSWYTEENLLDILNMSGLDQLDSLDLRRDVNSYRYRGRDVSAERLVKKLGVEGRLLDAGVRPDVAARAVESILTPYTYVPRA